MNKTILFILIIFASQCNGMITRPSKKEFGSRTTLKYEPKEFFRPLPQNSLEKFQIPNPPNFGKLSFCQQQSPVQKPQELSFNIPKTLYDNKFYTYENGKIVFQPKNINPKRVIIGANTLTLLGNLAINPLGAGILNTLPTGLIFFENIGNAELIHEATYSPYLRDKTFERSLLAGSMLVFSGANFMMGAVITSGVQSLATLNFAKSVLDFSDIYIERQKKFENLQNLISKFEMTTDIQQNHYLEKIDELAKNAPFGEKLGKSDQTLFQVLLNSNDERLQKILYKHSKPLMTSENFNFCTKSLNIVFEEFNSTKSISKKRFCKDFMNDIFMQAPKMVHTKNNEGKSLIWQATENGNVDLCKLLFDYNADPMEEHNGENLLMISPTQEIAELVEYYKNLRNDNRS